MASETINGRSVRILEEDQLALRIGKSFEGLQQPSTECSIFKVPIQLRRENDDTYEPHMLAIGPYHREKDRLQAMEVHKRIYLKLLLNRTGIDVTILIDALRGLEVKARKIYAEYVSLDSDQFVEMMLLDGCFVVELLRKNCITGLQDNSDLIFKGVWMMYSLKRDMLLLENQLPFFVLHEIYIWTQVADLLEPTLKEMIKAFFNDILPGSAFSDINYGHNEHLLDFVHRSLDHPKSDGKNQDTYWGHIRCATELQEAGITFMKSKKSNLFEITFHNGILEIPEIIIENRTESFLRNLIAYEQCSLYKIPIYLFDYVRVMDRLINSEKDVELLRRHRIINNTLGNDEVVAKMFNKMCHFVAISGKMASETINVRSVRILEDQLALRIGRSFEGLQQSFIEHSIFKVPIQLRRENDDTYEPHMLAIGPYHREKDRLQVMEVHKRIYLKLLLNRTGIDVTTLIDALRGLEVKARKIYSEYVSLNSDQFVEMMLLDGCFVVELLRKNLIRDLQHKSDHIFKGIWMINRLQRDMLLLENQLPFFVLHEIYIRTKVADLVEPPTLKEMIKAFFKDILPGSAFSDINDGYDGYNEHLLDFVHKSWDHPKIDWLYQDTYWGHIRCATELQEAGITFMKSEKSNLFEITFHNGILQIPEIIIENRTESFLRNLIAHEQCSLYKTSIYLFDYVIVMDQLINSEKDVELLRLHRIINTTLGNDEVVAKMFNTMCNSVTISGPFHYFKLFNDVNEHCDKRWNFWMAKLRRNYFNSPWALISFTAAVIILLLTLTQTNYAILSYHHHI